MIPLLLAFTPGSGIEDFIHTLESQDLTVEITSQENITEELKHNGAIKVSREGQVRIFPLALPFLPHSLRIKQFTRKALAELAISGLDSLGQEFSPWFLAL